VAYAPSGRIEMAVELSEGMGVRLLMPRSMSLVGCLIQLVEGLCGGLDPCGSGTL
jgi:hypothetical protein